MRSSLLQGVSCVELHRLHGVCYRDMLRKLHKRHSHVNDDHLNLGAVQGLHEVEEQNAKVSPLELQHDLGCCRAAATLTIMAMVGPPT